MLTDYLRNNETTTFWKLFLCMHRHKAEEASAPFGQLARGILLHPISPVMDTGFPYQTRLSRQYPTVSSLIETSAFENSVFCSAR